MQKKSFILPIILLTFCLLTGCGSSSSVSMSTVNNMNSFDSSYEIGLKDNYVTPEQSESSSESSQNNSTTYSQKLILTYNLNYETKTFDDSVSYLKNQIAKYNGYIESSSLRGQKNRYIDLKIRIPESHVNEFLNETGSIGELVRSSESAEDITLNYYDTTSRLETLHTQHDRLIELLASAETLEDIITLEGKLSDIEYEINRYQSTLNIYDNLINYVTINISISEVETVSVIENDNFFTRISKGFTTNLHNVTEALIDIIVFIIIHIPQILLYALFVVTIIIIVKKIDKRKSRKVKIPPRTENEKVGGDSDE